MRVSILLRREMSLRPKHAYTEHHDAATHDWSIGYVIESDPRDFYKFGITIVLYKHEHCRDIVAANMLLLTSG